MPEPIITAGLITGAAALAGSGGQAIATGKLNKRNRDWQDANYEKQKRDALENWNLQNEYNAPAAQLRRFKEAGLNPNLIYGQGNPGNAESINQAKPGTWNPETPNIGAIGAQAGESLANYYNIKLQNAQISNQEKQGLLLDSELVYKGLRNTKLITDTNLGNQLFGSREVGNRYQESLLKSNLQFQSLQMDKMNQEMELALNTDERAAIQTADNHATAAETILSMRLGRKLTSAEISRIHADTDIKNADAKLKNEGGQPHDGVITRTLAKSGFLQDIIQGTSDFWRFFKDSNNNSYNKTQKK